MWPFVSIFPLLLTVLASTAAADSSKSSRYFVFGDHGLVHSTQASKAIKVGERLPIAELRKRFKGYKVTPTAGEDCAICAVVEGPDGSFEVDYDETGTLVQAIVSGDKYSHDALGNAVGSPLAGAIGEAGSCDAGMWTTCKSKQFSKLHYIVREDETCQLAVKEDADTAISACARIDGFRVFD